MKLKIGFALAAFALLVYPVHAQRSNGGGRGSSTASEWTINGLNNSFTVTIGANTTKLYSMTFPSNLNVSKITYVLFTADNTANLYDLGFYNAQGLLVCHIGATAGTSFAPANNTGITQTFLSPCNLQANVRYYFGVTGQAVTAALYPSARAMMAVFGVPPTSGSATSGGVLNSQVTPPADSWNTNGTGNSGPPAIGLHN